MPPILNYTLSTRNLASRVTGRGVGPLGRPMMMTGSGEATQIFTGPGLAGPGTTVSFGGSSTIMDARVALIFYGSAWNNLALSPNCLNIQSAVQTLLSTPYLKQLCLDYQCNGAVMDIAWNRIIINPPGNPFDGGDCMGVANDLINNVYSTFSADNRPSLYMFFLPPGVALQLPPPTVGDHSSDGSIYYSFQLYGPLNFVTRTFSHELVEAMSDPDGNAWQVNPTNSTNWNEICDVCGNSGTLVNGVFAAAYFSTTFQACVVPQPDPPPPPPPSLPNGNYQISCANLDFHHEASYITVIGGSWNGKSWAMFENWAIQRMKRGELTFYTVADGERANVTIGISLHGWEYLTTSPDNTINNNLDVIATRGSCDTTVLWV